MFITYENKRKCTQGLNHTAPCYKEMEKGKEKKIKETLFGGDLYFNYFL